MELPIVQDEADDPEAQEAESAASSESEQILGGVSTGEELVEVLEWFLQMAVIHIKNIEVDGWDSTFPTPRCKREPFKRTFVESSNSLFSLVQLQARWCPQWLALLTEEELAAIQAAKECV